MGDLQSRLNRYAELLVRVGINLQPGQKLMVNSSLEHADLVRLIVTKAYEAGARIVHVRWEDPQVTRLTMERADIEALKEPPLHLARWSEEHAAEGGAFLSITGADPTLMAGIDPARINTARQASAKASKGVSAYTSAMRVSWTVGAAPSQGWANAVLPELPETERTLALWDQILRACRVYESNDVVADWQSHLARLEAKTAFLNQAQFKALHFRAPGTDLTLDLPTNHNWLSIGGAKNEQGVAFAPNIPSEEVFTAPHKDGVNGVVRSTLPLNVGGTLIEGLTLRFENGRVVEFSAEKGQEVLKGILDTDEGARRLGEIALVPVESPINQTGKLFYNTLFDENASCHLAVGRAYPTAVVGGEKMTEEERAAAGLNDSLTHVDFMIGSPEMEIDGITADGERVPLFRKGTWA